MSDLINKIKPPNYKEEFFNIYNFNGITIIYHTIKNEHHLYYHLKLYTERNNTNTQNKLYIIYYFDKELQLNYDFIKDKNIFLLKIEKNYELFFQIHLLRHDYFYKNKIQETTKILEIYDNINVPFEKYPKMQMYCRKDWFKNNLINGLTNYEKQLEIINYLDENDDFYSKIRENISIETIEYYNILLENFDIFFKENFVDIMDFKEFASIYSFESTNQIYMSFISKNIVLENIYYINKCWFDKDKKPLVLEDFYKDFEYREFKNNSYVKYISDISNVPISQKISHEVMFLDYVYGFYNFGEFWDIIKRLLVSEKKELPLFHLKHNKITNIEYYFNKLNFKYPTNYQKTENDGKLYYFNKINRSTITGNLCRGHIDRFFAYNFNKILNPEKVIDKSYNIYLARSNFGRSIQNENIIVNILQKKYNFIVVNGSEKLEDTIHLFTNAKLILGAHGSLMKNLIWSKKNPILIELCPSTRHDCFYGNAIGCGFFSLFFVVDSDEKEEIILNDIQIENLYKLLDNI